VCLLGGRIAAAHVYGVPAIDPVSLAAGAALLLGGVVVASAAPARRAASGNPATLLRRVD